MTIPDMYRTPALTSSVLPALLVKEGYDMENIDGMSEPALFPDPFQAHPDGPWEKRQRQLCETRITLALEKLRAGQIDVSTFRHDKSEHGAKRYLWWQHHPAGGRWKYLGRPHWSVSAYNSFRQQYLGLPEHERISMGAPSEKAVPYQRHQGKLGIMHEHVVPQKVLLDWLLQGPNSVAEILSCNIGAVITREEDQRLHDKSTHPCRSDPWQRYRGTGIQFISNPSWTPEERAALARYGSFS